MIPTPATASDTEAIPASARVSALRIDENAESSASWVITVTSSARCRSAIRLSTSAWPASISAWTRTSTRMRNSEERLKTRIAVLHRDQDHVVHVEAERAPARRQHARPPGSARARRRTTWPSGFSLRNSSLGDRDPEDDLAAALVGIPRGRNWPEPISSLRTAANSAVVPSTGTARPRSPKRTVSVATAIGADLRTRCSLRDRTVVVEGEIVRRPRRTGRRPSSRPSPGTR